MKDDKVAGITVELIISTYNNPNSLMLCLQSVALQDYKVQSICVADDGSGPETLTVIENFAKSTSVRVRHIWHPDNGFQKSLILNRAIASSEADYLVFIDGDVMIAPGFVRRHVETSQDRQFNTGSLIRLDGPSTELVTKEMIHNRLVFSQTWLNEMGALKGFSTWLKSAPLPKWLLSIFEIVNPIRRSFCGANSSVYRKHVISVNGYDERIKYGGQDKELGERLKNLGLKGRHLRYTAPLVHLDHPRSYNSPEIRAHSRSILEQTRSSRSVSTDYGIRN